LWRRRRRAECASDNYDLAISVWTLAKLGYGPLVARTTGAPSGASKAIAASVGKGSPSMEMTEILPYAVQAVGGVIGGNILGALTRGGGGIVGRTIIGAIGGVAAGYAAPMAAPADLLGTISTLIEGENGAHLGNLIVGAGGGGVLGLISGLLIRPSA
jgi:hypothetical protein